MEIKSVIVLVLLTCALTNGCMRQVVKAKKPKLKSIRLDDLPNMPPPADGEKTTVDEDDPVVLKLKEGAAAAFEKYGPPIVNECKRYHRKLNYTSNGGISILYDVGDEIDEFYYEAVHQTNKFVVGPNEIVAYLKSGELKSAFVSGVSEWFSYQLLNPKTGELRWYYSMENLNKSDVLYFKHQKFYPLKCEMFLKYLATYFPESDAVVYVVHDEHQLHFLRKFVPYMGGVLKKPSLLTENEYLNDMLDTGVKIAETEQ